MELLERLYNSLLLTESVGVDEVNDALDNHKRVIINYRSKGEDKNTGARVIEVYAYGLTKAGNPCIRAFQPYGDTTSRVPSWKFFRLDRIIEWKPTEQTFDRPADFYYKNLGNFNPNGDETMSVVYKVAKFGNDQIPQVSVNDEPKTKEDVYKTDSETRMERLKQQVNNPIKLSDIKIGDAFKQAKQTPKPTGEPKTKEDVYTTSKTQPLTQNNPNTTEKTPQEKQDNLDRLRNILKDRQPISLSDLNKKMKEEPQERKWQDVFNQEAEKDLEQMNKNDAINQRRRDNRWEKSADSRPLHRKGSLNRM